MEEGGEERDRRGRERRRNDRREGRRGKKFLRTEMELIYWYKSSLVPCLGACGIRLSVCITITSTSTQNTKVFFLDT